MVSVQTVNVTNITRIILFSSDAMQLDSFCTPNSQLSRPLEHIPSPTSVKVSTLNDVFILPFPDTHPTSGSVIVNLCGLNIIVDRDNNIIRHCILHTLRPSATDPLSL